MRAIEKILRLPGQIMILLIRAYQLVVSPMLGPHCRFAPTCSSYAIEAIQLHGVIKGFWLALRRVTRCHPWHPGGYDPVPPQKSCCEDHPPGL